MDTFFPFHLIMKDNVKIKTASDVLPSHGLNAEQDTTFLIRPSVKTAVSDGITDVFVNPFEGLKWLIENKGKHRSPLQAMLSVLYFL